MLWIKKGKEPVSLTLHKMEKYASYDNCNKEDIRKALLKEQGYLCAYCMRRISIKKGMKIEHWYPEAKLDESGRMDYRNMLGCCMGHEEGGKHKDDTCDTHKDDEILTIDPRKKGHINIIRYRQNGEICSDNLAINKDLNETLNLNCSSQYLKENRKAVLDALKNKLKKLKGASDVRLSKRKWMKILREYSETDANGQKKEYAGIVIWYIKGKI